MTICDELTAALDRAAGGCAPAEALDGLRAAGGEIMRAGLLARPARIAALLGQTAHESAGYTERVETLWYSASRILDVWPTRYRDLMDAERVAGNPEKLANEVYGDRLGNTEPGDGWRYRGRGWLQLTGRDNYRRMGERINLDLEGNPDLATDPAVAWRVAALFMAQGEILGYADRYDTRRVTRSINNGEHGLEDRTRRTAAALSALAPLDWLAREAERGPLPTAALQIALIDSGRDPGPVDGILGPRTRAALS